MPNGSPSCGGIPNIGGSGRAAWRAEPCPGGGADPWEVAASGGTWGKAATPFRDLRVLPARRAAYEVLNIRSFVKYYTLVIQIYDRYTITQ